MVSWVLYECALLVLMVTYVSDFLVKWDISNFLSFSINVDVMFMYVVLPVAPCHLIFGGLSKNKNIL
jgi:hypothetical protein